MNDGLVSDGGHSYRYDAEGSLLNVDGGTTMAEQQRHIRTVR
jgi:hypothetical protein